MTGCRRSAKNRDLSAKKSEQASAELRCIADQHFRPHLSFNAFRHVMFGC